MQHITNRFEYGAKILLTLTMVMIPLWFLPMPVGIEFGREVTFSLIIIAAFILWLLSLLTRGEIHFTSSLLMWATGLLILVFGVSTFLSKAPFVSLTYGDPLAEKFTSLLLGILFMFLCSNVLSSGRAVQRALTTLIAGTGLMGVFSFFQLIWGTNLLTYVSSVAQGIEFNLVGTMNGLSLFYVAVFVMALGMLFSGVTQSMKKITRYIITATPVILMVNLLIIHFWTSWVVLLGALIFLFGLMFMYQRAEEALKKKSETYQSQRTLGLDWRYSMLIFLIALSVVMLIVRSAFLGSANLPAEVSPAFITTFSVAKSVFNEGTKTLLFGSGPATFILDWSLYRDPLINQTQFWNVAFTQGYSWFSTLISTTGVLGVLSFILFIGIALIIFLRHLLRYPHEENTSLGLSVCIGFIAMIFIAILYPSTLTFVLMFFGCAGFLSSLFARSEPLKIVEEETSGSMHLAFRGEMSTEETVTEEIHHIATKIESVQEVPGWWDITRRVIRFENPWIVFISSLLAIFFLSLGVATMYVEIGRLRAMLIQQDARDQFNKGNIDEAITGFARAVTFESNNYHNYIPLIQARMEKIRILIQRAAGGNNVQQEFQNMVSLAIQDSQRVIQYYPANSLLWRLQGSLYELLIPFIPGSEKFSFDSYNKAINLDPLNPSLHIDLARAGLIASDRFVLTIQQAYGADRDQMQEARVKSLQDIITVLQKAVEIKPDLADSHFLTTQAALRLGNLSIAIQSAEKTKLAAPFDVGVAFQLGLLYYQANDIDKAQIEFERAIAMNNNYSNARYFLGLIYDRKGSKDKAIEQFNQIQAFNPDNQEVKNILTNLHAGKSALEGIVPPATSPEKRSEAPVQGR